MVSKRSAEKVVIVSRCVRVSLLRMTGSAGLQWLKEVGGGLLRGEWGAALQIAKFNCRDDEPPQSSAQCQAPQNAEPEPQMIRRLAH